MKKEGSSFGDHAEVSLQTSAVGAASVGIEGHYHVVCRDAEGNIKWEESFPNLVDAVGKELMLDTLLSSVSPYTTVGPYLGLIDGSPGPIFSASDTMAVHAGWTEFTNYTVGGSPVRGTAAFAPATSSGMTPTNATNKTAAAITFTITGLGGTVAGCFLVTGAGASNTQGNTSGILYSSGAFATPKVTTAGDTVSVTYSTIAIS